MEIAKLWGVRTPTPLNRLTKIWRGWLLRWWLPASHGRISTKICTAVEVMDLITCDKFFSNRLRFVDFVGGQIWLVPKASHWLSWWLLTQGWHDCAACDCSTCPHHIWWAQSDSQQLILLLLLISYFSSCCRMLKLIFLDRIASLPTKCPTLLYNHRFYLSIIIQMTSAGHITKNKLNTTVR